MNGEFAFKASKMTAYLKVAIAKSKNFKPFPIDQIPRDQNTQADAITKLWSALSKPIFDNISMIHLAAPSIKNNDIVQIEEEENDWSHDIQNFLIHNLLPEDKMEARKIRFKASTGHRPILATIVYF